MERLRGATDHIVEEDGEERVEKIWGIRGLPIYPVPIGAPEVEVTNLGESISATPIFEWLESHVGDHRFTIEDTV
jgi:hypothetical protein